MEKTRAIKNRIKSVSGTRKITKAMEMIASSKIRKAQERILEARPYISKIEDTITDIACYSNISHPLLVPHDEIKKVLIIGVTADRGLCGGYNSNIIRVIEKSIKKAEEKGQEYLLDIIGTRGKNHFRYMGYEFNRIYENLSDHPRFLDAREIAEEIISSYTAGEIDKVILCYTRFKNPAEQVPSTFVMLPIPFIRKLEELEDPDTDVGKVRIGDRVCRITPEFTYDPSPGDVLQSLLTSYVYTTIYTVLLEATASETGARMTAMKNASDNAEEMIKDLNRQYHRARQQQITMEITEIVSGADALTGS
jgi:F-type H+-transporting ATPase subunit gamma